MGKLRKDGRNATSLCSALQSSSVATLEIVKLLLFHTADANERDGHGKSPLHYAVNAGHHPVDLIMELARAGARLSDVPSATRQTKNLVGGGGGCGWMYSLVKKEQRKSGQRILREV